MTGRKTIEFAAQYDRTAEDWIVFPADAELRKTWFVPEVMEHPAKANLYMILELINWASKPGETIMDITAGTGSIMLAAITGRHVVCIEIEEDYCKLMEASISKMSSSLVGRVTVLHGDCRKFLPLPADHIIFSPPYANILHKDYKATGAGSSDVGAIAHFKALPAYSQTPGNLTLLNRFLYNQEMERIYSLCYQSLPAGGTLSIILKDYTEKGKRVYLTDWMVKCCVRAGFSIKAIFKRYSPGTGYLQLWKSKGLSVVEDEDIAIMEKP